MKTKYRYIPLAMAVIITLGLSYSGVRHEDFVDISEDTWAYYEELESHAEEQASWAPDDPRWQQLAEAAGESVSTPATPAPTTPAPAAPAQNQTTQATTTQSSATTQPQANSGTTTKTTKSEPTEEEIAAAWVETERVEPTCTEDGKAIRSNSITGETSEEVLPAIGHSYSESDRVEPTCTTEGKVTYTCATCGDTYDEVIPAKGHTEGEPQITEVKATLFKDGYTLTEVYCTKCGELRSSDKVIYPAIIPVWARIAVPAALVVCAGIIAVVIGIQRKRNKINGID